MTARALRSLVLVAGGLLFAACGGGDAPAGASDASSAAVATQSTGGATQPASLAAAAAVYDFATGPAVLVGDGFEPSQERVDSTGAYLPVNGRPTLVFVDAIW